MLLMACANVASLLLSRLGAQASRCASRWEQRAADDPAVADGKPDSGVARRCVGRRVGFVGTRAGLLAQGTLPQAAEIRVDGGVLLFTLAISCSPVSSSG